MLVRQRWHSRAVRQPGTVMSFVRAWQLGQSSVSQCRSFEPHVAHGGFRNSKILEPPSIRPVECSTKRTIADAPHASQIRRALCRVSMSLIRQRSV